MNLSIELTGKFFLGKYMSAQSKNPRGDPRMKLIVCAFALCCVFAIETRADEIVIVPTGGQLSWFNFQGPAADVASITLTGVGFSIQATNQEASGKQWSGLCPINCTGSVSFNGFGTNSFSWSAGAEGDTAVGRFTLFAPNSIPFNPNDGPPPVLFTLVFTASGNVVIDTPDRFLFVINDQTAIPEPATILLLSSGFAGLVGAKLKKRFRRG